MAKVCLDVTQLQLPLSQVAQLLCATDLKTTTFTFLTHSVRLSTNSEVALSWADLALIPYFAKDIEDTASTCYVIYLSEAEAFEMLPPEGEPEPIRMHYGKQGLRWELGPDRDLIREAKYNNWYIIDRVTRSVLFLAATIDRATYKEPTILVREMILGPLPAEGYLPLHGSVAILNGSGIAFLGDRGSGKTTMLLNCIDRYQADYVANDRFFVRWQEDTKQLWLYGTPESCRVGFATMRTISKLALHLHIDEHIEGATLPLEALRQQRSGKIAFLPREISKIMNRQIVVQAPIRVMSCVKLNSADCWQELAIKALNREESKLAISDFVLHPDFEFCNWLRLDTGASSSWSPSLIHTWEAVLGVPIYKAVGGENGAHLLEHLLKQLRVDQYITVPPSVPVE